MTGPLMGSLATHLRALDLLEVALSTPKVEDAWPELQADLEVWPREDLIRLAMALAVEARVLTPVAQRPAFRKRLEVRRLQTMTMEAGK